MNSKAFSWLLLILSFIQTIYSKADLNHLGFGFDNQNESVIIPFKSFNNLIIIESVIDDKNKLNLILDTGIRSLVLFDQSYIPRVSDKTFDIKFTGTGMRKPISGVVSINHNLRLCDDVVANQINAVILKKSNSYLHKLKGIKIHGVFGYQLFSRFQVKIDYKNQLLTLSEPNKINKIPGFEAIPISIHDTKPFIKTCILTTNNEWQKLSLILDLGANHKILLLVDPNFSDSFKKASYYQKIAEGLSGSIYGNKTFAKTIRLGSVAYNDIEILVPTKTTYHHESMEIEKNGSIGGRIFDDSTIIIDYINGFLFIEYPNEKSKTSGYDLATTHLTQ